ncbi:DUF922 domain-containing protein [Chitinophaga rhizophila]|uniref:DUF922 domain-containing protein n=1 Tax=Chitinophaga rhizophila TaxID=2866212 RepID=A0ABS7GEP6_9BACT|nr:hypothetical protein [Chitinophaga rhizophila]MBW8686142.1 hypothetical protein [Chitinophaga rhizophila]
MFLFLHFIWCSLFFPADQPADKRPVTVIKVVFKPDRRPEDPASDSLFYQPHRKLQWTDFKATPPLRGPSAAVSYTSFAYEGSSLLKKDTLQINLTLQVFFIKSASWVKSFARDSYALEHEQIHFDITWLVALRFQQRIRAMELTAEDFDSIIQYQYIESFREMNKLQEAYDRETNHGLDPAAQKNWKRSVGEALATLTLEDALTRYLIPLSADSTTRRTFNTAW